MRSLWPCDLTEAAEAIVVKRLELRWPGPVRAPFPTAMTQHSTTYLATSPPLRITFEDVLLDYTLLCLSSAVESDAGVMLILSHLPTYSCHHSQALRRQMI